MRLKGDGPTVAGAAAEIEDPEGVLSLVCDVQAPRQVQAAFVKGVAGFGRSDVLVNNAGLSRGLEPLHKGLLDDWNEMIDTNVKGLLHVDRAVVPLMVARGRGTVIHIGSIAGRQVSPGGNVYCATKYAVRALTQGMRIDLLGTKVRCSSVDPGMVETEFSEVRFHGDTERAHQAYQNFPPLKAEDIAETVLFCATRPPHVNIHDVLIRPQDQAAVYASHPRRVE